jgi:peptide deformylase
MSAKKILTIGEPLLRSVSHPVKKFDSRLSMILRDMTHTMYDSQGVGLVRPEKVTVRAQDKRASFFEVEGEGLYARALQHEIDHLDGVLYVDKMSYEIFDDEEEEVQEGAVMG